jgi:hypothetical protein
MKFEYELKTHPEHGEYHYFTAKLKDGEEYYSLAEKKFLSYKEAKHYCQKALLDKEKEL